MEKKLSDYVWEYIASIGIRHVFMFPGGGAMHLVDSVGRSKDLQYVPLLHEQACSFAAETYARISYNMGAVLVTTGPGGTNAVTGCAAAWLESTPVIFISGQVKTADLKGNSGVRQHGNQEIGIVDIVQSITKYAVTVTDPETIKYHLEKAAYMAKEGRPGPVWLDIPLDVQAAMIDPAFLCGYEHKQKTNNGILDEKEMAEIIQLLVNSKRPVLIAGQGIERNNGKKLFRELTDYLQIPILTSWLAVELLAHDHPCNMGKPGMVAPRYSNFTMQNSDLILAIGTRLDPAMIGYSPGDFAPSAKKIIVDIDSAELNKFSFPIEKTVQVDATLFIRELLRSLKKKNIVLYTEKWLQQCIRWKEKYPLVLKEFRNEKQFVNPYHFVDHLSDCLADKDVIIPGSSGAGIDVFWLALKNKEEQRALATGSLGSMGYGLPAAIGACLASGQRTICVEGDGSIQLNIQELANVKGMNLPLKIFILDNGGYLSVINMQNNHFKGHFVGSNSSSRLYLPDILSVAAGYGIPTFEINSHHEMDTTIKAVLSGEGPALCRIHVNPEIAIQPKVMSQVMPDGSMRSGTLMDLWPYLSKEELEAEKLI